MVKLYSFLRGIVLAYLLLSALEESSAQHLATEGSSSQAMGGANLCLLNAWSAYNNPALLSRLESSTIALTHRSDLLLPELSNQAVLFQLSRSLSGYGIGYSQFGFEGYRDRQISFSTARKLDDNLDLGIQFLYRRLEQTEFYGNIQRLAFKLALAYSISDQILIGSRLNYPINPRDGELSLQRKGIDLGFSYQYSSSIDLHFQLNKQLKRQIESIMALEYNYQEDFYFRIAYAHQLRSISFGFGLEKSKWQMDLSSSFQYPLGFSPSISINYFISRK